MTGKNGGVSMVTQRTLKSLTDSETNVVDSDLCQQSLNFKNKLTWNGVGGMRAHHAISVSGVLWSSRFCYTYALIHVPVGMCNFSVKCSSYNGSRKFESHCVRAEMQKHVVLTWV